MSEQRRRVLLFLFPRSHFYLFRVADVDSFENILCQETSETLVLALASDEEEEGEEQVTVGRDGKSEKTETYF